jgi:hypothetical protein
MITANSAGVGGGIFCGTASSPVIVGNAIAQNIAGSNGGGIYACGGSSPMVLNSILWADSAGGPGDEICLSDWDGVCSMDVSYSDVEGGSSGVWVESGCTLYWGDGSIDEDPMFVLAEKEDYRLLWGSPCIDAGHPDSLDADGTRRDMGVHFFDQSKTLVTYLTPEARTVARGETCRVLFTLINCHGDPQPARGIVELAFTNGQPWPGNPLEGPGYGVIPPEYNWQYVREYTVPETWPLGTTWFTWKVGMPGDLFDTDLFRCTVVAAE